MPDERREDAPAQHHNSRNNADDADLDPADIARLLRIGAVEKTPGKRRQDNGKDSRLRHALYERDGKKAKQKFLAGRGHQADGHTRDPRESNVDRDGVVQILRRQNSITAAHHKKREDEADMSR